MEDFFKKQLTNYSPAEDGWNVPSDKMWDVASTQFPKKKEKRRGGFYFLLGSMFLLSAIGTIYLSNIDNNSIFSSILPYQSFEINKTETNNKLITNNLKQSTVNPSQNKIISKITLPKSKTNALLKALPNALPNTLLNRKTTIKNRGEKTALYINNSPVNNITKQSTRRTNNIINNIINQGQTQRPTKNSLTPTPTQIPAPHPINNNATINPIIINPKIINLTLNTNLALAQLPILKDRRSSLSLNRKSPIKIELSDKLLSSKISKKPVLLKPTSMGIVGREIGLSGRLNLLSIAGLINISESNDDISKLEILSRNLNLNFDYSTLLSKRFSITSQLQISTLDMQLDFQDEHALESNEFDWGINTDLAKVVQRESILAKNNDIKIELEDGLTFSEGDDLIINAVAKLKARALQLPVMFNIHGQNKKRTEFYYGVGFSLDYINLQFEIEDLDVLRANTIINTSHTSFLYNENHYMVNLYKQLGLKVHISPHINLGLHARYSVLRPEFSGIEVGIFYRWAS